MAGTSKPPLSLRFHTESAPISGDSFTMTVPLEENSGRKICISKVPVISEQDVRAIYPFPADDGTLGCAFKLDEHGRIAIDTLSQERRGSLLLGFVNSRLVTTMEIDRHVTSGVLYIARGLRPEEIEIMKKHFPVLGENKKKPAKKRTAELDPNAPKTVDLRD